MLSVWLFGFLYLLNIILPCKKSLKYLHICKKSSTFAPDKQETNNNKRQTTNNDT